MTAQELHHNDFQIPVRTIKKENLKKKKILMFLHTFENYSVILPFKAKRRCNTVVVTPLVISIPRTVLEALMSTNKEMRI